MQNLARSLATLALLASAGTLSAQTTTTRTGPTAETHPLRFGAQLSYAFEAEQVGVGLRMQHPLRKILGSSRVDGLAELNWFPGDFNIFDLNYNVIYRFNAPSVTPYAGGGLAFLVGSGNGNTESDLNLNVVGGIEFKPMGVLTPFVQLRYLFAGDGDGLILSGGVFF